MALTAGTRLGAYDITGELGTGGMGEVYRATDIDLKREVAIKILPTDLAEDADRLARFQREAEVLASLNHPNIAQIYGLERGEGTTALVMELVEGPTLADRIAQAPIPPDEALQIAMQIADALEAAHNLKIVHRDLKPANVKLRPDGAVKVLDFGIAKALESQAGVSGPQTPSLTTPAMTQAGILLGTAGYMSPEQARGKAVDERADIWAFGCVLYEMLTGQPAFVGEDVTSTLARVLERNVDMRRLPPNVSPGVEPAIALCLQKDLKKRLADIRDVRLVLQGALEAGAGRGRSVAPQLPRWRRVLPAATAAVLAAAIAVAGMRLSTHPEPIRPFYLNLAHPAPEHFIVNNLDVSIAISPDGRRVAYAADEGGTEAPLNYARLYVRALDEPEPLLLTDRARMPFFSPDGRWVGFVQENQRLSKVSIMGGAPVPIGGNARAPRGATWGPDDTIVFANYQDGTGLFRIAAGGGDPETLTTPDASKGEIGHRFPEFLPGGKAVLFTIVSRAATAERDALSYTIAVLDLATGRYRALLPGNYARYSPSGHVVYSVNGKLNAVPFDLDRLEVTGAPQTVMNGVASSAGSGAASFDLSASGSAFGTLIFLRGMAAPASPRFELTWVDRAGAEEPLGTEPEIYRDSAISPDGGSIAVAVSKEDGGADVRLWSLSRRIFTRLISRQQSTDAPIWTPDGRRVVYMAFNRGLFWRSADGTGNEEMLLDAGADVVEPNGWTPDGDLLFTRFSGNSAGIFALAIKGDRTPKPVLANASFREEYAAVSPDGRWLAYQSDESGTFEVYVRPLPDTDSGKWQVSSGGGRLPKWRPNGRELFFIAPGKLMAVTVDTDPTFKPGVPQQVLPVPDGTRDYEVARDGQRFLFVKPVDAASEGLAPHLNVVLNWSKELARLVPAQ